MQDLYERNNYKLEKLYKMKKVTFRQTQVKIQTEVLRLAGLYACCLSLARILDTSQVYNDI